jgi:hypothetical protein
MSVKNNLSLIFGISIPILMVIFVAISIYVPQIFIKPGYDFLYLIGRNECYIQPVRQENSQVCLQGKTVQIYSIQNGKLIKNITDEEIAKCQAGQMPQLKIFLYDINSGKGRETSYDHASSLNMDSSLKSPDGFEIIRGSNSGGFFPFYFYSGNDYNSRYITGNNISKKLNIQQEGYSYYNFVFLGWIKN